MRVAVIGGGVFGCTAAVDLARAGFDVELFEARWDVLQGATARNQARLHSGYHYPRSDSTAAAARDASALFAERYPDAIIRDRRHWYAVAPESKVSPDDYLAFLDRLGLPYEVADGSACSPIPPPFIHTADLIVRAHEAFIDVPMLWRLLRRDLAQAGVMVHLGRRVLDDELPGFDVTVWATYGAGWPRPLRTEVCEVALLELGRYAGDSVVVIDGEFTSLDPRGRLYALYDVKHSVHHVAEGIDASIPDEYSGVLERGTVRPGSPGSSMSRVAAMVESASRFFWGLEPTGGHVAIYHGSMWSVRRVLPAVDGTDERPTLVERDGNVIRVLSGKMCTAVAAARAVVGAVAA